MQIDIDNKKNTSLANTTTSMPVVRAASTKSCRTFPGTFLPISPSTTLRVGVYVCGFSSDREVGVRRANLTYSSVAVGVYYVCILKTTEMGNLTPNTLMDSRPILLLYQ